MTPLPTMDMQGMYVVHTYVSHTSILTVYYYIMHMYMHMYV